MIDARVDRGVDAARPGPASTPIRSPGTRSAVGRTRLERTRLRRSRGETGYSSNAPVSRSDTSSRDPPDCPVLQKSRSSSRAFSSPLLTPTTLMLLHPYTPVLRLSSSKLGLDCHASRERRPVKETAVIVCRGQHDCQKIPILHLQHVGGPRPRLVDGCPTWRPASKAARSLPCGKRSVSIACGPTTKVTTLRPGIPTRPGTASSPLRIRPCVA